MTTLNAKTNYRTALVALLMIAGAFVGTGASADAREMKVKFTYNPHASAEEIYSGFEKTAERACQSYGVRPFELRKQDAACAEQFLGKAVERLGRADVAQIHSGKLDMVASR